MTDFHLYILRNKIQSKPKAANSIYSYKRCRDYTILGSTETIIIPDLPQKRLKIILSANAKLSLKQHLRNLSSRLQV